MRHSVVRRLCLLWSLGCAALAAAGCGEGTAPGAMGQLRLRAVFAPGEEPEALGVAVSDIRVRVQRTSGAGAVVVDTTLPFETGATLSWILDVTEPPETMQVTAELGQGASTLYAGSNQAIVNEGIGSSSGSVHDVPVAFLGVPAGRVVVLDITPDSAGVDAIGATIAFRAAARDADGAIVPNATIVWSTADSAIATIESVSPDTGRAIARGVGRTKIYATVDGVVDSAILTVSDDGGPGGSVASIEVSPPTALLTALGASQQFTAVARNAKGVVMPGVTFSWSSANPGVASVDANGRATADAQGVTSITASAGGLTASARLIVAQVVSSVTVAPSSVTLAVGDSTAFTAVAKDANGHPVPGATFTWSSSNPAIASLHPVSGMAVGHGQGGVTVRATSGSASGAAVLTVVEVGEISVSPSGEPQVTVNGTVQFTAVVRDLAGNVIPGVQVRWSSTEPLVASIDASSGLARGLAAGRSRIVATAGQVSRSVALDVVAPGTGAVTQTRVSPPD